MISIDIINKLSNLRKDMQNLLQMEEFDYFSIEKNMKTSDKINKINKINITDVYLPKILQNSGPVNFQRKYKFISDEVFKEINSEIYDGALFIFTNNDIGEKLEEYINFFNTHSNAFFVIWDWDPQHWTYMSCMLAMHCDFYISSASENAFLISHFNPNILGPVFGGVNQWSRLFILENFKELTNERSNEPSGEHAYYPDFSRRNRAIKTVSIKSPGVKFSDLAYQSISDLENLRMWTRYKAHWIMPVLCGVPVRVHNAILTGGIPIVPSFYKNIPEIQALGDIPLFYDTTDLIDPAQINSLAIEKFDSFGVNGLIDRINFGLENNHIDSRVEELIVLVEKKISQIINSKRR